MMQFNVIATWNHAVVVGRDAEGRDVTNDVDTTLRGVYDPGSSQENTDLQQQVTTTPTFILEPGSGTPDAEDRLTFPAPIGVMYVDGTPDVYVSPFPSGRNKIGPVVHLKATTG